MALAIICFWACSLEDPCTLEVMFIACWVTTGIIIFQSQVRVTLAVAQVASWLERLIFSTPDICRWWCLAALSSHWWFYSHICHHYPLFFSFPLITAEHIGEPIVAITKAWPFQSGWPDAVIFRVCMEFQLRERACLQVCVGVQNAWPQEIQRPPRRLFSKQPAPLMMLEIFSTSSHSWIFEALNVMKMKS